MHIIYKTRDLKGLKSTRPCDNLFQTAVDKYIILLALRPILYEFKYKSFPGIPHVFFLGNRSDSFTYLSKVILLHESCS